MPKTTDLFVSGVRSSGSSLIDRLLGGGFETDIITTAYGPAGSGKTNLALISVAHQLKEGKRVIFVDTEGSFSVARMQQLLPNFEAYAHQLLFLKPTTFAEQKEAFEQLKGAVYEKDDIALIVVDSVAMLYRLEIGKSQDVYAVNRELGMQLGMLTEIARKFSIPVLLTNQVYADFDNKDEVKMVGGDLLKYSSKCLLEFSSNPDGSRSCVIRKHRSIAEHTSVSFTIADSGFTEVEM